MRVGQTRRVQAQGLGCTGRAYATYRSCLLRRVALYFFASEDSSGLVTGVRTSAALALAAQEAEQGQSLATCPDWPQNMQRLFSKQRQRSSLVSFPSLPSFDERSDVEEDFFWD